MRRKWREEVKKKEKMRKIQKKTEKKEEKEKHKKSEKKKWKWKKHRINPKLQKIIKWETVIKLPNWKHTKKNPKNLDCLENLCVESL